MERTCSERAGARVAQVSYDGASGRYRGDVIFSGPSGIRSLRVSTPGHPAWGLARVSAALVKAAERAGGAPP